MKRIKKHKVKVEKPEASTSHSRHVEEYDLTYHIHDRVELMHQVFSVLRHKDLKAMAPECVRHISIDDLQELCTEELLGISSKRLCAILDGADPPSDTDSSSESPERLETISLDSISSDEEILSETSSRKSKKHKRHRRDSRTKSKKKKNKESVEEDNPAEADKSRASRAGLTVLELLELQARARAIRAQLQQEQAAKQAAEHSVAPGHHSSDNEVEIKEEPAEVVEISSDDEKPKIEELREKTVPKAKEPEKPPDTTETQTVTKRINDLIITVPQVVKSRKIKLNRTKVTASVANNESSKIVVAAAPKTSKEINKTQNTTRSKNTEINEKNKEREAKTKESKVKIKEKGIKIKEKKKKQKKVSKNQDSDHDEITLQLSDTEKMDLLEDLDRKNYEKLSSSDSEDSETSSSDSESQESDEKPDKNSPVKQNNTDDILNTEDNTNDSTTINISDKRHDSTVTVIDKNVDLDKTCSNDVDVTVEKSNEIEMPSPVKKSHDESVLIEDNDDNIEITSITDIPIVEDEFVSICSSTTVETETTQDSLKIDTNDKSDSLQTEMNHKSDCPSDDTKSGANSPIKDALSRQDSLDKIAEKQTSRITISVEINPSSSDQAEVIEKRTVQIENIDNSKETHEAASEKNNEKDLSDGELSDRESSEIEAVELKPEVVCISDDETDKKSQKKKKKKEKKSKNKKSKKSKQDFREGSDQNFYKETEQNEETDRDVIENIGEVIKVEEVLISVEDDDYDDVYEILELSDDSSCYEVEGTVLSKEPTAKEIEALSAKIDEIEREDVVTEEDIREHERRNAEDTENIEELENISWKDRYLDSKKVKKVLSTSSIFNALRKKNRELKKKLDESKKKEETVQEEKEEIIEDIEEPIPTHIEDGSIEQYNTLEGLTKYVDPVQEVIEKTDAPMDKNAEIVENENEELVKNGEIANGEVIILGKGEQTVKTPAVGKEIRKDAKQLLKMYKRLLKYNDMNKRRNPNKQKDPNKKKKKKSKKKNNDAVNTVSTT